MSDRLRVLLAEAATEIEPRSGDPVPAIRLRHRRQVRRTRIAVASATAVAVVATLAAINVGYARSHRPDVVASPHPWPVPTTLSVELAGTQLNVNGVTLEMPPGWAVLRHVPDDYCDIPDRTIAVSASTLPGNCDPHEQIDVDYRSTQSPIFPPRPDTLIAVTLPGGQPAWLYTHPDDDWRSGPGNPADAIYLAYLPWSAVDLAFALDGTREEAMLRSMRTPLVPPSRLVLPSDVGGMLISDPPSYVHPPASQRVREMLAALDRPVQPGELPCAGATDLMAGWRVVRSARITMLSFAPLGNVGGTGPAVVIHEADGCSYATSSIGGQVWLPDGFMARLREAVRGGR